MPQKECEDLVLQAVTQVTDAPHFHSHYFGTLFYHLFLGNQERRQLRRMVQDGDYHQGQNQLISALLLEERKINHPQPTLNRTGWRGSCGWTTSCPSSTKRRNEPSRTFKRNNFTIQYVMCVQRINMLPVPIEISLCDNNLWSIHLENCPKHPCKGDLIPFFRISPLVQCRNKIDPVSVRKQV